EGKQKRGQKKDSATVHVTVSIGFADASQASQPDEVLQLADQALYKAKQAGRNCIRGSE
ncbi:GGDEF domain-containing protein, partial [Enterococcus faecalis]